MSVEPYQWLIAQATELGYDPANVGPASVDLCLGAGKAYYLSEIYSDIFYDHSDGTKHVCFKPDIFFLCSTVEYVKVPVTHCAFINMRSSLARKGLGHKMAGFIDPGFEGQVTLELETNRLVDVKLGERIVQLIYMRLTEPTVKPYKGKYLGQRGPTEAYV